MSWLQLDVVPYPHSLAYWLVGVLTGNLVGPLAVCVCLLVQAKYKHRGSPAFALDMNFLQPSVLVLLLVQQ